LALDKVEEIEPRAPAGNQNNLSGPPFLLEKAKHEKTKGDKKAKENIVSEHV